MGQSHDESTTNYVKEFLIHLSFMSSFAAMGSPDHYKVRLRLAKEAIANMSEDEKLRATEVLTGLEWLKVSL